MYQVNVLTNEFMYIMHVWSTDGKTQVSCAHSRISTPYLTQMVEMNIWWETVWSTVYTWCQKSQNQAYIKTKELSTLSFHFN